jgi:hypothetical protein
MDTHVSKPTSVKRAWRVRFGTFRASGLVWPRTVWAQELVVQVYNLGLVSIHRRLAVSLKACTTIAMAFGSNVLSLAVTVGQDQKLCKDSEVVCNASQPRSSISRARFAISIFGSPRACNDWPGSALLNIPKSVARCVGQSCLLGCLECARPASAFATW